jgi:hypothetical protein
VPENIVPFSLNSPPHVQAPYFLEISLLGGLGTYAGMRGPICVHTTEGQAPRKVKQSMWLSYWHRFNNHLATGKTSESFFVSLS